MCVVTDLGFWVPIGGDNLLLELKEAFVWVRFGSFGWCAPHLVVISNSLIVHEMGTDNSLGSVTTEKRRQVAVKDIVLEEPKWLERAREVHGVQHHPLQVVCRWSQGRVSQRATGRELTE